MKNYAAARDVYQRSKFRIDSSVLPAGIEVVLRVVLVIDVDPDEHEAKMRLAEIYDNMNEKRLALDLVNQGRKGN